MKEYDIFSDPEFKADCDRDQILYENNICPNCRTQWEDQKAMLVCPCLETLIYQHVMKIECAWCGLDMGNKPCNKDQCDKISHSICPKCLKKTMRMKEVK